MNHILFLFYFFFHLIIHDLNHIYFLFQIFLQRWCSENKCKLIIWWLPKTSSRSSIFRLWSANRRHWLPGFICVLEFTGSFTSLFSKNAGSSNKKPFMKKNRSYVRLLTNKLQELFKKFPVIYLTGPRHSRKTTLAQMICLFLHLNINLLILITIIRIYFSFSYPFFIFFII